MNDMNAVTYEPEWVSPEPGVVVGYQRDAAGIERLIGVLVYDPTAERVRTLPLRKYARRSPRPSTLADAVELEQQGVKLDGGSFGFAGMWPAPPTSSELEAAWARVHRNLEALAMVAESNAGLSTLGSTMATPEALRRVDGEPAAEFYWRVSVAYKWLDRQGRTPTSDIAEIAKVPHTTAAKWVREARVRGLLEPTTRGKGTIVATPTLSEAEPVRVSSRKASNGSRATARPADKSSSKTGKGKQ